MHANFLKLREAGTKMLRDDVMDGNLSPANPCRHEKSAGNQPVRNDGVHASV
ncbi:hypothetical protein D3C71_1954340 [compost metagenome]